MNIHRLMEPSSDILPCDRNIFENGETVAIIAGGSARLIERFVRELAEFSGEAVDWHYMGGRGVVKTTGDIEKVRDSIMKLTLTIQEVS